MQRFFYLFLNISIVFFPLLLTFEKKIKHYKHFPAYLKSIGIVSTFFIIWDIWATARGDWSFNSNYILGVKIINLPIEEILFFFTVPYSLFFIFETIELYFKEKIELKKAYLFLIPVVFISSFFLFHVENNYTFVASCVALISLIIQTLFFRDIIKQPNFILLVLFSYIPFLVVNYILTSLPIVIYNSNAIMGARFFTIPIEDFIYSFDMVSLWLLFYVIFKRKIK